MIPKQKKSSLVEIGSVITFRIPQGTNPKVIEALNKMSNRSQTLINLVELVIVQSKMTEELLQSIITGKTAVIEAEEIACNSVTVSAVSPPPIVQEEQSEGNGATDIFLNQAMIFYDLTKEQ